MPDGFPEACGNLDTPCRWTMWNLEGQELYLYALMALATVLLIGRLWMRVQIWLKGQDDLPFDHLGIRIGRVLQYALGQARVLRDRAAGLMHAGIFFGFTALFIGTTLATIDQDIAYHLFDEKILKGTFYRLYELGLDAFTLFFILGLGYALYRRGVLHPKKLTYSRGFNLVLLQLWLLVLSGLILEAFRLAALDDYIGDTWGRWSFAGWGIAQFLLTFTDSEATWRTWHEWFWWFHSAQVFVFIVSLADSPLKHIIYSPLNIFFSPIREPGELKPLDLEDETIEQFGVGHLTDFTVLQLMDGDACTECGRCQAACPAYMAGTPLNPKEVILDIRRAMNYYTDPLGVRLHPSQKEGLEIEPTSMPVINLEANGEILLTPEAMWACTTCRACVYECPVLIQHVDSIVDIRRHLVLMEGAPPDLLGNTFTNAERTGNPWADRGSRVEWTTPLPFDVPIMAEKKKVDVLYWIGCAGAFDPNSQKTSRAVAKILNTAGVDWAILGDEEQCHCEWARRGGNEFLYQESVIPIVETLNSYEFDVIITHCPHCFNTMKNEFPDFGGEYTVIHHSQYIAKLIAEGRIKPDYSNGRSKEMGDAVRHITYHDSCYLGRYNDVYEDPRAMLKTVPGVNLIEMARSKDRGLCCGGGGAQVWMETHQEDPVNMLRLTEAVNALNGDVPYDHADAVRELPAEPVQMEKPGTIATACPFCTVMLDSAQQSMQVEDVQIRDVAEIVADGLD